jgi:hypothetical protein
MSKLPVISRWPDESMNWTLAVIMPKSPNMLGTLASRWREPSERLGAGERVGWLSAGGC